MTLQNLAPIYSSYSGDEDMAELIELFVNEIPEKLEVIQSHLSSENWEELRRVAHQLKGSAGGYGFDCITAYAQRLESALHGARDLPTIQSSASELISQLSAICLQQ